jgi:hypothetical protein
MSGTAEMRHAVGENKQMPGVFEYLESAPQFVNLIRL